MKRLTWIGTSHRMVWLFVAAALGAAPSLACSSDPVFNDNPPGAGGSAGGGGEAGSGAGGGTSVCVVGEAVLGSCTVQ